MNNAQRQLLAKTLSDVGKGILIAVLVALGTDKMDPWIGTFAVLGAINLYVVAHNLLAEGENRDQSGRDDPHPVRFVNYRYDLVLH